MSIIKKDKISKDTPAKNVGPITYKKLFWLFMVGSLIGVPLEGFWCLAKYGHWETHVVTVWGPFCIIYGLGAVGCYIGAVLLRDKNIFIRFITFALIGDGVELICGLVLEYGLNMYAWDYSDQFLNVKGYVSLFMTVIWGLLGIGFGCIVPYIERVFDKIKGKAWNILCIVLSVFMAINFAVTAVCLVRWKNRHEGAPQTNGVERWIDENFDDSIMSDRFCEWRFFD